MGWAGWIRTVEIAPAIDAADAPSYERRIDVLLRTGCRVFHLNGTGADARYALELLAPLIHRYDGIVDVHVLDGDLAELAISGADSVTVNADLAEAVDELHEAGAQAGIAFGDDATAQEVAAVAGGADLVLCSCNGDNAVEHVRALGKALPAGVVLQVEGDITHDNVREFNDAGACVFVTDRPIFDREDLPRAYRRLVQALA